MILNLVFFFIFSISSIQARLLVFSDVDDTIKQTDVLDIRSSILSLILHTKEFTYLKKIMIEIANNKKNEVDFVYLSASPNCLVNQTSWLKKKGFPQGLVIQRDCKSGKKDDLNVLDKVNFKFNRLNLYLKENFNKYDEIFYFGDNAEKDPTVYAMTKMKYSRIKSSIFIRDIRANATPIDKMLIVTKDATSNYFFSEKDLILMPQMSFLSTELKKSIEAEFKNGTLFPSYLKHNLSERYEDELNLPGKMAKIKAVESLQAYVESH